MSKPAETAAMYAIAASAYFALRAQVFIWASNVIADSFDTFTGLSFRQGLLVAIFTFLLQSKVQRQVRVT